MKLWEDKGVAVAEVLYQGHSILVNWQHAKVEKNCHQQNTVRHPVTSWKKPLAGYYKCNVDACFNIVDGVTGFGMCVRDSGGNFILAKTTNFKPVLYVHEGEAYGILEALRWLTDLQLEHGNLESDSLAVVDSIK